VAFNPVEHGFAFANAFTNHLVHVPALGLDVATRGRCGGMAFASLDYWHNGLAVPDSSTLPVDGTLVADYVMARMNDSAIANAAKNVQFLLTPDNPTWLQGIGVARQTREQEYPRLKQALDAGTPVPIGIVQARDVGSLGNDHQVVAYGYEDLGRYSHVYIYDNNAPGQECVLEFTTVYDSSETEIRESVMGMTWRGFFVESYAQQLPTFLADGRLLAERSNPAIYVLRGGGRFHIPSPAEFDAGGFDWRAVMQAQPGSLEHVATRPANGTLIRERSTPAVFLVLGGRAFSIPDAATFDALGLRSANVRVIPDGSLGDLVNAALHDGTLLRELHADRVSVARGGTLHWIPDAQTFDADGFVWSDIGIVPDGSLAGIPAGTPLPSAQAQPLAIARSWAERPGDTILTAGGDRIDYVVDAGAVAAKDLEFVLTLGPALAFPHALHKQLIVRDANGAAQATLDAQDAVATASRVVARSKVGSGGLLFRTGDVFGTMQDAHTLANLDQLPKGSRVTFTWQKD
jgi:hypothetical protein